LRVEILPLVPRSPQAFPDLSTVRLGPGRECRGQESVHFSARERNSGGACTRQRFCTADGPGSAARHPREPPPPSLDPSARECCAPGAFREISGGTEGQLARASRERMPSRLAPLTSRAERGQGTWRSEHGETRSPSRARAFYTARPFLPVLS